MAPLLGTILYIRAMEKEPMSNIILEEVKGSELPKRWAEKLGAQPDERFTVTIQSEEERRAAAQELERLMGAIGCEAQEAGLTPEALSGILGTDVKPLL
jgi:hypothetical protein